MAWLTVKGPTRLAGAGADAGQGSPVVGVRAVGVEGVGTLGTGVGAVAVGAVCVR